MTTRYRITYSTGIILVNTQRGTISISHRQPSPTDDCLYVPVLNADQRARMEALGATSKMDNYTLPLDQAHAVFALAAEAWGQPTSNNSDYPIPAPAPAAPADDEQPTAEGDPQQAAARIIREHGETLYAALQDHIAYQARNATTLNAQLTAEDNEDLAELAERILDIMTALPDAELWSIDGVAEHIGAATASSARRTLGRWGVRPVGREAGRGGQNLYDPAQVKAAKAARPGRGHRSDLRP